MYTYSYIQVLGHLYPVPNCEKSPVKEHPLLEDDYKRQHIEKYRHQLPFNLLHDIPLQPISLRAFLHSSEIKDDESGPPSFQHVGQMLATATLPARRHAPENEVSLLQIKFL